MYFSGKWKFESVLYVQYDIIISFLFLSSYFIHFSRIVNFLFYFSPQHLIPKTLANVISHDQARSFYLCDSLKFLSGNYSSSIYLLFPAFLEPY